MESRVIWSLFIICSSYTDVEASLRILGGRDALKDEFPFAVRLEVILTHSNKREFIHQYCTGAAISPSWIITAGHCYIEEYYEKKKKQFVRYNSYFPKHKGQLSALLEFHVHPGYDFMLNNDIGLFRCEKISVLSYVKISAVDYKSFIGREGVILGFGGTNASETDKPLQVLKGMFYMCPDDEKSKHKMCVASSCSIISTICGGDSGGPVLLASSVVGVNSASADDCDEDTTFLKRTPGTAASIVEMVSPHINWIQKITSSKANMM